MISFKSKFLFIVLLAICFVSFGIVFFKQKNNTSSFCSTMNFVNIEKIAIGYDGATVYAIDNGGRLIEFSTLTHAITQKTISKSTSRLMLGYAGKEIFLTVNNGDGFLSIIKVATNTLVTTIPIPANYFSYNDQVAVSPDWKKVYLIVKENNEDKVFIIDSTTKAVIGNIPVGYGAVFSLNIDGTKLYVLGRKLSIIDTLTNIVLNSIPLEGTASSVAINQDGTEIAVTISGDMNSSIKIIDAITNQISDSIEVKDITPEKPSPYGIYNVMPENVMFAPNGISAYAVDPFWHFGIVYVVDLNLRKVVSTIPLGSHTFSMAISPDGEKIYLLGVPFDGDKNVMTVIDAHTNSISSIIPVPDPEPTLPEMFEFWFKSAVKKIKGFCS